ncbi:MAG TPA: HEAT repeat domain-containing protein, partial [Gemmataceae bacterium]
MPNRASVLVSTFHVLAFAGVVVAAPGSEGPTFRGKRFAVWVRMLEADDPKTRLQAVETLAVLGPEARTAVPALIAALKDKDEDVRGAAAKALSEVGPGLPEVVDALARASKEPGMSWPTGHALCRCGSAGFAVIEAAFAADGFRSGLPHAVRHAPPNRAFLPILIAGLKEPDKDLRRDSARAVARLGPAAKEAVPALLAIMQKDEDEYIRIDAAEALVEVADPKVSVPALVELMRGDGWYSGRDAADLLGRMGTRARAAVPDLLAVLDQKGGGQVRAAAALALWRIDRRKTGIRVLLSGLANAEGFDVLILARALDEIGSDAVPELVEALMCQKGAKARPADKPRDESAVVADLIKLLADEDADLRREAARLLGVLGTDDPAAISALTQALRDKDKYVRRRAARVLALLGKETTAVVPVLHEILRNGSREDSDRAAWLVWRLERKPAALVPALIARLEVGEHDDAEDHVFAAEILGWIGQDARPAVPALCKALRHDPHLLRRAAADALGGIGGPIEDVPSDLLAAAEDDDPLLRVAALRALGAWGEAARPARFVVADRMRDKNPLVRRAAALAWQRLHPTAEPPRFAPLTENEPLMRDWTLREWLQRWEAPSWADGGPEEVMAILRASSPHCPAAVRALAEAL